MGVIKTTSSRHSRSPSVSKQLLVVETDGFSVRAAVVRRTGKRSLSIDRLVQASRIDPLIAAADAIEELQKTEPHLPRKAIVVSVEVTPALLNLPIAPNGRAPEQLQNALRWEMEPRVAQRIGSRQIGGILMGLGILSSQQVEELLADQKQSRSLLGTGQRPPRLGELAVDHGYATKDQLKSALELQRWFTADEVDLTCGWSTIRSGQTEGRHPWLVASLCRERRQRWKEILRAKGIELEGVYPLAGSAGPVLSPQSASPCACIQFEQGLAVLYRFQNGHPESLEIQYTGERRHNLWESFRFLVEEGIHNVWVCGRDVKPMLDQLDSLDGCNPNLLQAAEAVLPENVIPESLIPMIGAARHALGLSPKESAVCVPARDPAAPLLKRPFIRGLAIPAAAVLLCLGVEFGVSKYEESLERDSANLERQLEAKRFELKNVQNSIQAGKALLADLDTEHERLKTIHAQLKYYENDLPHRARFLPELLEVVSRTVTEDIFIESLEEKEPYHIELEGWALSDQAAQSFYQVLSTEIKKLGLDILEESARHQEGGTGAGAYALHAVFGPAAKEGR